MAANSQPKSCDNGDCIPLLIYQSNMEEMRQMYDVLHSDLQKIKEKLNKKNKSLSDKFVDGVSLMGMAEAIKAKQKVAKLLWILVFLCCVGATTYFVYRIFEEYASNPTATKVKLVRKTEYSYPPMLLCVDTWLNFKKVQKMNLTKEAVHYALSFTDIMAETNQQQNSSKKTQTDFEKVYYKYNFTSLDDFFDYISLDAIRFDTYFQGDLSKYDDYVQVMGSGRDKRLVKVVFDYGVCYKLRFKNEGGKLSEYNQLVVRVPDLSSGVTKRKPYWKLYVNPPLKQKMPSTPFLSMFRDQTHTIKITAENYLVLNTPKEPCFEPNDIVDYSEINCGFSCFGDLIKTELKCIAYNYETDIKRNLSKYCNTYYTEEWDERMASFGSSNVGTKNYLSCTKRCITACDIWKYETSVDAHVSTELQTTEHKEKRNVSSLKLIFVNGDVAAGGILTFTEVYTYSFETLIGNIGGTCGIWIGASILTLIQLLSFCSKLCGVHGRRRLFQKKSNRNDIEAEVIDA